jgi:hypothetical protein
MDEEFKRLGSTNSIKRKNISRLSNENQLILLVKKKNKKMHLLKKLSFNIYHLIKPNY